MSLAFMLLALVAVVSAVGVISMRNPMNSAFFLILNLVTVAGIFALMQAHFLATVQIIVYAGAIMVLVVFVLMLLNTKHEKTKESGFVLLALGICTAVLFFGILATQFGISFTDELHLNQLVLGVFPNGSEEAPVGTVANIGKLLYTEYVFPFEAASILIMAAIVGAAMLAKRSHKGGAA